MMLCHSSAIRIPVAMTLLIATPPLPTCCALAKIKQRSSELGGTFGYETPRIFAKGAPATPKTRLGHGAEAADRRMFRGVGRLWHQDAADEVPEVSTGGLSPLGYQRVREELKDGERTTKEHRQLRIQRTVSRLLRDHGIRPSLAPTLTRLSTLLHVVKH